MIRRFQDFFVDDFDERKQFNNQIIFKSKNLNFEVRNAIKLTKQIYQLKNETTKLVMMIYFFVMKFMIFEIFEFDINEKGFDDENNNDFDVENIFVDDQSFINAVNFSKNQFDAINFSNFSSTFNEVNFVFDISSSLNTEFDANNIDDFMFRIKKAYKKNKKFQIIMKAKRNNNRKISIKLIKKKVRLKLNDCEIKHEFFWVKKRLHMFWKKLLQIDIIKHIYKSLQKNYVERNIIFTRFNIYYYWQNIIVFVIKYLKFCYFCRRNKAYREIKHKLFKLLFISDRYFKKIIVNFIIFLFTCTRNDKHYKHIIIIIDRFFKIKRFATLNLFDVDVVIQAIINWI